TQRRRSRFLVVAIHRAFFYVSFFDKTSLLKGSDMAIYTRSGDSGTTNWPNDLNLRKSDARIGAVGSLDELNAAVGWCIQGCSDETFPDIRRALAAVQPDLFTAGAMLVATWTQTETAGDLSDATVTRIEYQIDACWSGLAELKQFVLPGGCELACRLHIARTVCRRAERAILTASDAGHHIPAAILKYLNRLSDLLFTLARKANHDAGTTQKLWGP
ncbi:MAG: cob(I)yrinic acid a,c-diamide adenosyltransferase, partial [Phycisphaerae bacterium]|nr:cob(I)yrinic acid a,c-diamide adenosyltransferase [Phycisphaerae bacterium]